MMIMRLCNMQTNGYDHRVFMRFTRLFAHITRLRSCKETTQLSRYIYETERMWWYNQLRQTNNFRFDDDDDKMSYRYILSIT